MTLVYEGAREPNENYRNFGGLVSEVLNYGFNDGPQVNRKRIEAWLNEAQFQIVRQVELPEFQAKEARALERGVYRYTLPNNFLRMESVYMPVLSVKLRPVEQKDFDRNNPTVEGPPLIYLIRENEIWLYPTPAETEEGKELPASEAAGMLLRYYQRPVWMLEETSIPELNPNYWHLLVDYALWRAFAAEDDTEAAQAHLNTYKEGLDHMASDLQWRDIDGPRTVQGTWGAGTYGSGGWY